MADLVAGLRRLLRRTTHPTPSLGVLAAIATASLPSDRQAKRLLPAADVAALLRAHDLSIDTMCRCGWDGLEIFHADHVAQQLVETGAHRG